MGQEFIIKSPDIEDKINQLLPSQAGFGAGVDFSASTTVIPIVDLTETAEGSTFRQDLQTAYSINAGHDNVSSGTATIITTTGWWQVKGNVCGKAATSVTTVAQLVITDGTTTTPVFEVNVPASSNNDTFFESFDRVIKLEAGHSAQIITNSNRMELSAQYRQIADLAGNLINP